jgi:MFS family permease
MPDTNDSTPGQPKTDQQPIARRLDRNVWVLSIGSFLTDVSSEMINNLLPLFLANVLGVRTSVIGLIDGVAEATASLTKVVSGTYSDRIRKRKWLTVSGYLLSTIAKPFLYFATTWQAVLGVRFADRLGKGIRTAPRDALLAGSIQKGQRGLAFGLHRAADTAGAFIGLLIATIILWLNQAGQTELTRPTFQKLVFASIIPAVLAVIILAVGVREVAIRAPGGSAPSRVKTSIKLLGRNYGMFLMVIVLFTLGNSSDSFIILRGQERGLTLLQVMGMLLTFNAIYALLSSPAGAVSDRIGRKRVLLTGWGVYALAYLGLALAKTGWQVWLLFALYGVYYALTEGVARAMVADLVGQELRGTAYGYYHAAVGLAALPASLIAGVLWQGLGAWSGFGASAPFIFGAMLSLLAGILLLVVVKD